MHLFRDRHLKPPQRPWPRPPCGGPLAVHTQGKSDNSLRARNRWPPKRRTLWSQQWKTSDGGSQLAITTPDIVFTHLFRAVAALTLLTGCGPGLDPQLQPPPRGEDYPLSLEQQRTLVAVVETIAGSLKDSTTVCLELTAGGKRYDPPSKFIRNVTVLSRVVPPYQCPPTYTRMVWYVDPDHPKDRPHRPPGYVDPYILRVPVPPDQTVDTLTTPVVVSQGTVDIHYSCFVAVRQGPGPGRCSQTDWRVH